MKLHQRIVDMHRTRMNIIRAILHDNKSANDVIKELKLENNPMFKKMAEVAEKRKVRIDKMKERRKRKERV